MSDAFITTADFEQMQRRLVCDTIRCAWDVVDSVWKPMFGTPVTLRCMRCASERHDTINSLGQVASRRYVRPGWWKKYPKGTRPTHAEFRLMLIEQQIRKARDARRNRQQVGATA